MDESTSPVPPDAPAITDETTDAPSVRIPEVVRLEAVPTKLNQEPAGDIVFVHGLGGDGYKTWTADKHDEKMYWPRWVADELTTWQVWSLYYPARFTQWTPKARGKAMPLPDRAANLIRLLLTHDVGHHRPLIFITHSLGGLIAKEMLRQSSDMGVKEEHPIIQNTTAVVFLATPHHGSDMADLGRALAKVRVMGLRLSWILRWSPHIHDLIKNESPLRQQYEWYKNNARAKGISTMALAENYKVFGCKIVELDSANPGIEGVRLVGYDADHFGIAKPTSRSNLIHTDVLRFLRKTIDASGELRALDVVQQPDGRRAVLDQVRNIMDEVAKSVGHGHDFGHKDDWRDELLELANRYRDAVPDLYVPIKMIAWRIRDHHFDHSKPDDDNYCCDELILDLKALQYEVLKLLEDTMAVEEVEELAVELMETIGLMRWGVGEPVRRPAGPETTWSEEARRTVAEEEQKRRNRLLEAWRTGITFGPEIAVSAKGPAVQ